MSNFKNAIDVEDLGKDYQIGTWSTRGHIAKFFAPRMFHSLPEQARRSVGSDTRIEDGRLHALRGITFNVEYGEVLGIMGPNGAGKSTLLKVLSGITAPTSGRAVMRGRVGALLEVGTGFNYELTGRENIYLNGLMLGMERIEIKRKFDEIVEFSGVESFLDTPVKRYSSGMVTRLGFAVAAHLEPEILIVDEILAVGDAAFQRRCIEKMRNVASHEGRAVLFISHSIEAVIGVCSRAIRLDGGRLVQEGSVRDIVAGYLKSAAESGSDVSLISREDREGSGELRIAQAVLEGVLADLGTENLKAPVNTAVVGLPFSVAITLAPNHDRIRDVTIELAIKDRHRSTVTVLSNASTGEVFRSVLHPTITFVNVPRCVLVPGQYWIDASVKAEGRLVDQLSGVLTFDVLPAPFFNGLLLTPLGGSVLMDQTWATRN